MDYRTIIHFDVHYWFSYASVRWLYSWYESPRLCSQYRLDRFLPFSIKILILSELLLWIVPWGLGMYLSVVLFWWSIRHNWPVFSTMSFVDTVGLCDYYPFSLTFALQVLRKFAFWHRFLDCYSQSKCQFRKVRWFSFNR